MNSRPELESEETEGGQGTGSLAYQITGEFAFS